MNEQYLEARYSSFTYELKEGTKASYYLVEGNKNLLPKRISIGKFTFNQTGKPGSDCIELKATYTKEEGGKYKGLNKGDSIHTRIYPTNISQEIIGYGILDERHKIYDLVVFQEITKSRMKIHHFEDMARPEYKAIVWHYLKTIEIKKP